MKPARPSSSAAPLRESDIGLLAPEDDEPRLPTVRILGMKPSVIVIVIAVIAGAFFGLRAFMEYSTSEVKRANIEVREAFSN